MTTKPKAKKFRIKRGAPGSGDVPPALPGSAGHVNSDGEIPAKPPQPETPPKAPQNNPKKAKPDNDSAPESTSGDDINAIRQEGLTGRQLRMARRVAHKHKLPATSDFDAVRLLRKAGIDPFKRSNMLELVVPQGGAEPHEGAPDAFASVAAQHNVDTGRIQLPQTIPQDQQNLPSAEVSPADRRNSEIQKIQRDIQRRRRRKLMQLLARLSFFVLLPTFVAGWFFYKVATPMYSAKSEFLILQADNAGGGGLGGLLTGTQWATAGDSIAVQAFLESKGAMLRLDQDVGFKSYFTQDWLDPIQRLSPNATNEAAYKLYRKNVKIGFDPTEGVIRMEVIAADPTTSVVFSEALISYAEQRVNNLSKEKRGDQMNDAREGFDNAKIARRNAQEALVGLQQKGAILDPEGVIAGLRSQISSIEVQIQDKDLQLAALLDNARPNRAKVDGARGDIRRLNNLLETLKNRMINANHGENSLAQLTVRIQMAQADLAARDMILQSALQQVEQTRMEANRQVRYLTNPVVPVESEEASYPRKFENTILAFLIFAGIYLMMSLTASILREQVSQ